MSTLRKLTAVLGVLADRVLTNSLWETFRWAIVVAAGLLYIAGRTGTWAGPRLADAQFTVRLPRVGRGLTIVTYGVLFGAAFRGA